jgi:bacterioferritin
MKNVYVGGFKMSDRDHPRPCKAPGAYPEPKVLETNPYYATLLLEDYTGMVSEMTATNQYLFHHFTIRQPKISELLECIALNEMAHIELLAKTITLLGVSPEFRTMSTNIPNYWSAGFVYYGIDVHDKLSADITAEHQAIHQCRYHQQLIADPHIQELLERIIQDEEYHVQLFENAINQLGAH